MIHCIVKSRIEAETRNGVNRPHAIISIRSDRNLPSLSSNRYTQRILYLCFDDVDDKKYAATMRTSPILASTIRLFSHTDASAIAAFVRSATNSAIDTFVIHCHAGISRSAAVAAALSKYYNGNDSKFFQPPYNPNRRVYRILLHALCLGPML